jgi:Fur family transcriptional regulator, peroxide stress response regulator
MPVSGKEIKRRLTAFTEACREHGMKLTHQRLEVFKAVARTDEHPDVETVFEQVRSRLPTISLDTVYRTLTTLERLGVISRVNVLQERARFDANTGAHHHFLCTECGAIKDFSSSELDNFRIPAEVQSWGKVKSVRVELRSTCKECLKRNAKTSENLGAPDDNLKKFGKKGIKGG